MTGILEGAAQIAVPALVSTICICIVFLPMFFLSGVARYLFVPLAEAVIFAMIASYILSRTLVPTLAMYLLKTHKQQGRAFSQCVLPFPKRIRAEFRENSLVLLLSAVTARLRSRSSSFHVLLIVCLLRLLSFRFLARISFPDTDSGQFILHVRAKTGTRIEETARLVDQVEGSIRGERFLLRNG